MMAEANFSLWLLDVFSLLSIPHKGEGKQSVHLVLSNSPFERGYVP